MNGTWTGAEVFSALNEFVRVLWEWREGKTKTSERGAVARQQGRAASDVLLRAAETGKWRLFSKPSLFLRSVQNVYRFAIGRNAPCP